MKLSSAKAAKIGNCLSIIKAFLGVGLALLLMSACSSKNLESNINNNSEIEISGNSVSDPLRVLIDVEFATSYVDPDVNSIVNSLVSNLKRSGADIGDVEFEYLPKEGEKRAAALTHMQTEVMTGKGPDLFICACTRPQKDEQALFRFPTQIMDRKLFLPLDDFIEDAEYTDFDRLAPMIIEQGRNGEGQQIIPLAFTLPMTVYRKSDVLHEHSKTMTRADMLSGDDYLKKSAIVEGSSAFMSTGFKELADYENETLCFSEDDLRDYLMKYYEQSYNREQPEAPNNFTSDLSLGFIDSIDTDDIYMGTDHHGGLSKNDQFTMVPVYSNEGGYVAYITSFAAINRNTKKAKEAFILLDYLLSPFGARSELYGYLTYHIGMPINMDLGKEEMPISDVAGSPWCLTEENYQEYCSLRDNISSVRFSTPLENDIMEAYLDIGRSYYKKSQGQTAEEPEKIISDAYRVMKMELAES